MKASDEDLEALHIHEDPRKSAEIAFSEMSSGMLIFTEGRGGAVLHTTQGVIEKSAYPIAHVEDTVGAGDAFHSAFLASLYRSGVIREPFTGVDPGVLGDAVDFACAAAAINVSRVGCFPPTKDEVDEFMDSTRR